MSNLNFRAKPYAETLAWIHELDMYKNNKKRFLTYCQDLHDPAIDILVLEFDQADPTYPSFFDAPAASEEHGNFPGGLMMHSLNVYDQFTHILDQPQVAQVIGQYVDTRTRILCSLFHDLCKWRLYEPCLLEKDYKGIPKGAFKAKPYTSSELNCLGHSVKSLFILQQYGVKLTQQQAALIRWHMGMWDRDFISNQKSIERLNPECILFASADWIASQIEPKIGGED